MSPGRRAIFDAWLEEVLDELPPRIHALLDEAPLIVDDRPDAKIIAELGLDPDEELLCGLHTGTPLTERSVEGLTDHVEMIHLFREGIVLEAGGWHAGESEIKREIRITVLHEIGHHFGLEDDDLEGLGYG